MKNKKDYMSVITRIEETIYNQKFTGAASGFLNPNIIARDLGLVDKKEVENRDLILTPEEREQKIKELLEKAIQLAEQMAANAPIAGRSTRPLPQFPTRTRILASLR